MLVYLVAHRDRVVTKQELFDRLWPEQFVTDDALGRCVRSARRALGDKPNPSQYISTVRGRGYRFIASVQDMPEARSEPEALKRESESDFPPSRTGQSTDPAIPDARTPPGPEPAQPAALALEGEYKYVTALCGTLLDASRLASQLGPESMHVLMQRVFAIVRQAVQRYMGTLIEFGGERFLALFGAPVAQEDHAQRAVLAALAVRQALQDVDSQSGPAQEESLSLSMGLHTGRVLVGGLGEDIDQLYTAMGETTRLACQLSAGATSGAILISAAMQPLIAEDVQAELDATIDASTFGMPQPVYRLEGLRRKDLGHAGRGARVQSPFVGRQHDMAMLDERFAAAMGGQGQVISLVGEPGIGKSRLLAECCRRFQTQGVTCYQGQCLSYGSATPYLPVLDILRQRIGVTAEDAPDIITTKARQCLHDMGVSAEETLPFLLPLLNALSEPERLTALAPPARKERTFAILRQLILHEAQNCPLVVMIDNLHWIDATSEEWLTSLVERLPHARMLLLVTHRPGYQPPWLPQSVATQIALQRLARRESRVVVNAILQTARLPHGRIRDILARANGNPLFLEALAWDVMEHADQGPPLTIPETVQAVIAARIDRLEPTEKRLLQIAATIGTPIAWPVLAAVSELPSEALATHVRHLCLAEFLLETQSIPEPAYMFKHVLIQDVAYQSLVTSTQQHYHQRIAEVIAAEFPDIVQLQPERLAHHYTGAACHAKAVSYWRQAGLRAQAHSAHLEAVSHLTKGIDCLTHVPDTVDRHRHELELQLALAPSLVATQGFATPDVGRCYRRAMTLGERVGQAPQQARVLMGLRSFYIMQADLQTSLEVGERLLHLAQDAQDPILLGEGHRALGQTLFHLGEFPSARTHLQQALAIYAALPAKTPIPLSPSGLDPNMFTLFWLASVWWILGYPDQAMQHSDAGMTLARERAHPFNLSSAFGYRGAMYQMRGLFGEAAQCFQTAIELACKYGMAPQIHQASYQSVILTAHEQSPQAFDRMHQALDACRATGTFIRLPTYLAHVANAYRSAGRVGEALAMLTDAFAQVERTGEHWYEAELYRLWGECLLVQPREHEHMRQAELSFR